MGGLGCPLENEQGDRYKREVHHRETEMGLIHSKENSPLSAKYSGTLGTEPWYITLPRFIRMRWSNELKISLEG